MTEAFAQLKDLKEAAASIMEQLKTKDNGE